MAVDLFEDLESFVFEVDGAEVDRLELAQDAGDFSGFAAEAHMVDDAFGLAMEAQKMIFQKSFPLFG